jgi:hypothetical protein
MDEINLLIQEAAEADRLARLELDYEIFLEEMYYFWDCEQLDRDLELYNEFG